MATNLEDLRKRLLGGEQKAASDPGILGGAKADITDLKNRLMEIDPEFDQSGVQDFWFRAGLSRMDTPEEQENYLNRTLGGGGWIKDKYGHYAVTQAGAKKRGYDWPGRPLVIEDRDLTWSDIADVAGAGPAVIGATGAGLAATGYGATVGIPAVAAGGMAGKGIDELVEYFTGYQRQSLGEVATDIVIEGAVAGAGEGVFRGLLRPLGRKIMAPEAKRFTPRRAEVAAEAQDIGARPTISQIVKPPLIGRWQSMINRVLGDPLAERNITALNAEITRLKSAAGPEAVKFDVGEAVAASIRQGRGALSKWAGIVTGKIDEATGGAEVVPTAALKAEMRAIKESMPKSMPQIIPTQVPSPVAGLPSVKSPASLASRAGPAEIMPGKVVFTPSDLLKSISDGLKLPDRVTISEMQAISQRLFDAIGDDTIVPGITGRNARLLWKGSRSTFGDIEDEGIRNAVGRFQKKYAKNIQRFDNALVARIVKNPRLAGLLDPEQIVPAVFRKGNSLQLHRLKSAVSPGTWQKFQRAAMDDIMGQIIRRTDDPVVEVFAGKNFLNALDKYGKHTLEAVFGARHTRDLYRLGRVTQLVTQSQAGAGGLVAAHVALHPISNFGRLVRWAALQSLLNTPFAVRWFTEGLRASKTRLGAEAVSRAAIFMIAAAESHTASMGEAFSVSEETAPAEE